MTSLVKYVIANNGNLSTLFALSPNKFHDTFAENGRFRCKKRFTEQQLHLLRRRSYIDKHTLVKRIDGTIQAITSKDSTVVVWKKPVDLDRAYKTMKKWLSPDMLQFDSDLWWDLMETGVGMPAMEKPPHSHFDLWMLLTQ
ncbi:hypothetical protein LTR12_017205 [Friedmanniomyces endolithicus]|nr:hypothetical protein LTR12_017205 [Friedmanniomyces endolithicus]